MQYLENKIKFIKNESFKFKDILKSFDDFKNKGKSV